MIWPFRRDEQLGGGARHDPTGDILSWAQRTFGEPDCAMTPVLGLLDSPTGVDDTTVDSPHWLPDVQDPAQDVSDQLFTKVTEEPADDGTRAEPTTLVVITTQWPEAFEGEAHIFPDPGEAKRFVERLIDDGFDRNCIKTVRGAPAHFNLSFRAVVDFD
jgi:hypothetical protein